MADKPDPKADSYSEEETAQRRDQTIRAMIGMPPKAHKEAVGSNRKQRADSKHRIARRKPKP